MGIVWMAKAAFIWASLVVLAWMPGVQALPCQRLINAARDFELEIERANAFWSRVSPEMLAQELHPADTRYVVTPWREALAVNWDNHDHIYPGLHSPAFYYFVNASVWYSAQRLLNFARFSLYVSEGALLRLTVAHEFGHHVLRLLGLYHMRFLQKDIQPYPEHYYRHELLADCLAGFYLSRRNEDLNALKTAVLSIGTDRLSSTVITRELVQQHHIHPTAAQRLRWFLRGWNAIHLRECQTLTQPLENLL